MKQPNILIISDDAAFPKAVTSHWRSDASQPAFTLLGSDRQWHFAGDAFDMAIVGGVMGTYLVEVLNLLSGTDKPVLAIVDDPLSCATIRQQFPHCIAFCRMENWNDVLVAVGSEVLKRLNAEARTSRAENERATLEREAALGRYMLDMRHSLNNALTSILGNAELLLLEHASLSTPMLVQLDTIRSMSLRIHEALQRFSSLEKEINFSEGQNLIPPRQQAAVC